MKESITGENLVHDELERNPTVTDEEASTEADGRADRGFKVDEEPYRSLYEHTPAMMHSIDREGRLVKVNDKWLKVLGYRREEVIGRRSTDFLTDASRHFAIEYDLPEFYRTGIASNVKYQMVKKNGQIIDVVLSANAARDEAGEITEAMGYIVDVTGQKRYEESLREREKHAVQEANENAVLAKIGRIINSSLVIHDVYQLFAIEVRELIPFDRITISEVDLDAGTITPIYVAGFEVEDWKEGRTHPISHSRLGPCVYDQVSLLFDGKSTRSHAEENPETAAGAQAGFQSGVAVPLISKGRTIGSLNLSSLSDSYTERDKMLTERVGAQIAGAVANAQLYDAEKKHQETVREMAVSEERNRLAREIHDTLAHSLTGIIIQLEIAGELVNGDPKAAQTQIEEVQKLARHSLEEARRSVWDLHPQLDISHSLTETIQIEVTRTANVGVNLSLSVTGEEPQSIDRRVSFTVLRIVHEALANVIKHARARVGEVQLIFEPSVLKVRITDDGTGFDTSAAHGMLSKNSGGFGLISMRERARLVGGDFDIRSAPGQGTRIEVYMPYHRASGNAATRNEAPVAGGRQETATERIRVLIVDDQELARQGIRSMLEQSDAVNVVGTAGDGEEALEAIRALAPDVVLLDVKMPKLDGVQTMKKLQESGLDTRVILLSVYGNNEFIFEGLRAGAAGYLLKDTGREELVRAIKTVYEGGSLLQPITLGQLIDHAELKKSSQLTERELEVLSLLTSGSQNKEIAEHLSLRVRTVRFHVENIYRKLGVQSRTQAVRAAAEQGLLNYLSPGTKS